MHGRSRDVELAAAGAGRSRDVVRGRSRDVVPFAGGGAFEAVNAGMACAGAFQRLLAGGGGCGAGPSPRVMTVLEALRAANAGKRLCKNLQKSQISESWIEPSRMGQN